MCYIFKIFWSSENTNRYPPGITKSAPIKHSSSAFSTPLFESVPYLPNDYVCPRPPSKPPRTARPRLLCGKGQIWHNYPSALQVTLSWWLSTSRQADVLSIVLCKCCVKFGLRQRSLREQYIFNHPKAWALPLHSSDLHYSSVRYFPRTVWKTSVRDKMFKWKLKGLFFFLIYSTIYKE